MCTASGPGASARARIAHEGKIARIDWTVLCGMSVNAREMRKAILSEGQNLRSLTRVNVVSALVRTSRLSLPLAEANPNYII
jgi:hypothetical protein